ncbi:MAG: hypothetical protein ACFFFB_15690, partial [Candidatus Heimdallarchaeota archaeon]
PTYYMDWEHPTILQKAKELTDGIEDDIGKVIKLFYFVKDGRIRFRVCQLGAVRADLSRCLSCIEFCGHGKPGLLFGSVKPLFSCRRRAGTHGLRYTPIAQELIDLCHKIIGVRIKLPEERNQVCEPEEVQQ